MDTVLDTLTSWGPTALGAGISVYLVRELARQSREQCERCAEAHRAAVEYWRELVARLMGDEHFPPPATT